MVLDVVEVTPRLLGLPGDGAVVAVVDVAVGGDVVVAPMVAVSSGVVTPPPRID